MKSFVCILLLALTFFSEALSQSFELYRGDTINRTDKNRQKQGKWIHFFRNPKTIREIGPYKNGRKTGQWKTYN